MPMGEHITNLNTDELITSYIDKQITDPETLRKVEDMLKNDEHLARKYKSELLTKTLLSKRLPLVEVPHKTLLSVTAGIDGLIKDAENKQAVKEHVKSNVQNHTFLNHLKDTLSAPIRLGSLPVPRYAAAIVVLVIVVTAGAYINSQQGSSRQSNAHLMNGSEKNIVKQAINNFHKILSGEIKTNSVPQNAKEMNSYMSEQAQFPVFIPDIAGYKLTGILCNEYNGQKLAHLVYKNTNGSGEEMIYIYQTQSRCIKRGDLEMPDEVKNTINGNSCFMCDEVDPQNYTLTVWNRENVVCASVTTLNKQKMNTTFASFNK